MLATHVPIETSAPRRVAKRLSLTVDAVRPSRAGVVVLAYHRVGRRTSSDVDLDSGLFRDQLQYLDETRQVVELAAALDGLSDPSGPLTPKVLTFDDGTADFVDEVLPRLVEFRLPATLYVATGHVDHGRPFPGGAAPISWDGLRECVSTGLVNVGAHTHGHVLLDRIDPATAALELDTSNARIADELGLTPLDFAYPKALGARGACEGLIRERYRSAAIAGTRANVPGRTDPHRLSRSPIQMSDGWVGFERKVDGGMRSEDDVRRLLNVVRYRGAST